METRSHLLLVSAVVAGVFAALIAFILWISPNRGGEGRRYDIVFNQSVSGLLVGSAVSFAGIPVGRVETIGLENGDPGRVRVRIKITEKDLTVQEGTVAALSGNLLFGTALISLENGKSGGGPIVAEGGGIPIIPSKGPGFGDLANDPTPLVNSIAAATDRLLEATSPAGQRQINAKLDALRETTAATAAAGPELAARVAQARTTLHSASASAAAFGAQAAAMQRRLDAAGRSKTRDLRASSAAGRQALRQLDDRVNASRTGLQGLSQSTEALHTQIQGLRTSVAAAGAAAGRVERDGVGGLVSEPTLPTYKPRD